MEFEPPVKCPLCQENSQIFEENITITVANGRKVGPFTMFRCDKCRALFLIDRSNLHRKM